MRKCPVDKKYTAINNEEEDEGLTNVTPSPAEALLDSSTCRKSTGASFDSCATALGMSFPLYWGNETT